MCSTGGTSMASPLDDETSASQDTPPKLSGDISPEHRDSIHAIACITCSTRKVRRFFPLMADPDVLASVDITL